MAVGKGQPLSTGSNSSNKDLHSRCKDGAVGKDRSPSKDRNRSNKGWDGAKDRPTSKSLSRWDADVDKGNRCVGSKEPSLKAEGQGRNTRAGSSRKIDTPKIYRKK